MTDHDRSLLAAAPQRMEMGEGLSGLAVWQAYRASIAQLFEVALPASADPATFFVASGAWVSFNTSLRRNRGAAQTLHRGPDLIAHGADQILIYVQLDGHVDHRCGGRSARIGPGDVVIYDYAQPIESSATAFENLNLIMNRDQAPSALLATEAHGFHLAASTGVAQLLVAGLTALEANAARMSMGEFEAAAVAMASLAAEPVRAQTQRNGVRSVPSALDQQRSRALAFVDANLADRSLSPDRIAAELKLSRSALYRLFEPYGGVRLLILARRLDRAVQVLLEESGSHQALGQVAKRHGFPTTAHFSRVFAERFGMPPSRYCALVREGDTAWLAAQNARTRFAKDISTGWQDLQARRTKE